MSAANPDKRNWKVMDASAGVFGGQDLNAISNMFSGPDPMRQHYTFRNSDGNKNLLTIDMDKKEINLNIDELYSSGYKIKNNGFTTILTDLGYQIKDLKFQIADTEMKLKEYRWAMSEISNILDMIRLDWNTSSFPSSTVGRLMNELYDFVRSKR